ncbi:MAG: sigma-54 dependent transcriptional regulator [candidate division WOR-3 bacterium]
MSRKIKGRILVIDDEAKDREVIRKILSPENYEVIQAENGLAGIKQIKENQLNLVLLDLVLPDINGIEVLKEIIKLKPTLPVIMISQYGTIKYAVLATKLGAFDWLEKPIDKEILLVTVRNALERERLQKEVAILKEESLKRYQMIGVSEPIQKIFNFIEKIAPTNTPVLITGESGVGKELVARAIHNKSKRKSEAFVKINCAAIPETLIESELFGYEKGAFTDAKTTKPGKLEIAHNGTLFLDEIGDLGLAAQAKLLRFLQEGEFERLGGTSATKVSVRIIAASNKNLLEEIERKNFRANLYYRLNVISIYVPPLRERKEDIPVLADYFLTKYCEENGAIKKSLTPDAIVFLQNQPWIGNVRELENLINRASILVKSPQITVPDLIQLSQEHL